MLAYDVVIRATRFSRPLRDSVTYLTKRVPIVPLDTSLPGIYLTLMRILCQNARMCCCQATSTSLAIEAAT